MAASNKRAYILIIVMKQLKRFSKKEKKKKSKAKATTDKQKKKMRIHTHTHTHEVNRLHAGRPLPSRRWKRGGGVRF